MPRWIIAIGAVLALATSMRVPAAETTAPVAIAIHGGAGTIERAALTAERREAIEADLARALDAGHAILRDGGSSLDAVTAAVIVLEDSPHFNARGCTRRRRRWRSRWARRSTWPGRR